MGAVERHILQLPKKRNKSTKVRLTKRSIEALETPIKGDRWYYCDKTPRLAVVVRASGSRGWYWVGRFKGRLLRYKLGGFPEMAPEGARKAAVEVSALVSHGVDPRTERRKERTGDTLQGLFDQYMKLVARPHKRSWKYDETLFNYCKPLRNRKVGSITTQDLRDLHIRVGKKAPVSANRVISLLAIVFKFGEIEPNPAKGIKRFPETERERFLSPEELPRLFRALEVEEQKYQDYFKLLLFTGSRSGNVLQMVWEELDLDAQVWTIPGEKFKNGKPCRVYLCVEAVDILRRRQSKSRSIWVFPGRPGTVVPHMQRPTKPWDRVCGRAQLKNLTLHDLRRSMGSWAAAGGESLLTIGKILGHANLSSTQIYARLSLDAVKSAVDKTVSTMLAAAKGKGEDDGEEN
jgi:integrase